MDACDSRAPLPTATVDGVVEILQTGWEIYENYTSPLGIGFVVSGGYGGGPCMGQAAYDATKPDCRHAYPHRGQLGDAAPCENSRDGTCPKRGPAYLKLHGR